MRFERRGYGGGGGGRRFGGGSRSFESRDEPKPVKVGEEYDVDISEVGSKGDGIARVKNFVVFVNGAKQGEKIKIKITDVRGRFAIGEKTEGASAEASTEAPVAETMVASDEGDSGDSDEKPEDVPEEETETTEEE